MTTYCASGDDVFALTTVGVFKLDGDVWHRLECSKDLLVKFVPDLVEVDAGDVPVKFAPPSSVKKGFSSVFKANPYHDERGRFATRDKHSFMSNGPAFQKTIERAKAAMAAAEKKAGKQEFVKVEQTSEKLNEYDTQMTEASQPEWSKLTREQVMAIHAYTGFESGEMNMFVSKSAKAKFDPAQTAKMEESCKLIDEAANSCTLPADTLLYRAMNVNRMGNVSHLGKFGSDSKKEELESLIGESFLDQGYGSASTDIRTAHFFRDSNRPIFAIKAPAGTKGLWVGSDHLPQTDSDHTKINRSGTGSEHEFIMQRNRAYKVVGVEEHVVPSRGQLPDKKAVVVFVEMLNAEMPVKPGKWGF